MNTSLQNDAANSCAHFRSAATSKATNHRLVGRDFLAIDHNVREYRAPESNKVKLNLEKAACLCVWVAFGCLVFGFCLGFDCDSMLDQQRAARTLARAA